MEHEMIQEVSLPKIDNSHHSVGRLTQIQLLLARILGRHNRVSELRGDLASVALRISLGLFI